jgi:hypothetical protein
MTTERTIRIIAKTRTPLQQCRSCPAMISFARTFPNEKSIPLDGEPVALKTEHDPTHGTIDHIAASGTHFATCPASK